MKKITCEICGSNDLIKKDGLFECQLCGTKYSVEEIKKVVLEGSIDISGSTVKIDNSGNIGNYLSIAKNAYNASNYLESERYCNRILEIDNKNYEALLLKGKLMCRELGIEGAEIYFSNALDNSPEDVLDKIKIEIINEISYINSIFLKESFENCKSELNIESFENIVHTIDLITTKPMKLLLRCGEDEEKIKSEIMDGISNFTTEIMDKLCIDFEEQLALKTGEMSMAEKIIDTVEIILAIRNTIEGELNCEKKEEEVKLYLSKEINYIAVTVWNNKILYDYSNIRERHKYDAFLFICRGNAVIRLLEYAVTLSEFDKLYSNLINVQEELILAYYRVSGLDYYELSEAERQERTNKIMEWHRIWNKRDATHIIPEEEPIEKGEFKFKE